MKKLTKQDIWEVPSQALLGFVIKLLHEHQGKLPEETRLLINERLKSDRIEVEFSEKEECTQVEVISANKIN